MSTVERVNLEPLSDILLTQRRDYPLADRNVTNNNHRLVRASDVTVLGNLAASRSFVLFYERGRYDGRAMAEGKADVIQFGDYEADTRIYDATVALGGGAAITAVMQPLKVATIAIGGRNYSGLVGHGGAGDTDPIVALVTRLPANNGGRLRYMRAWSI
jgi:hypothetical protein